MGYGYGFEVCWLYGHLAWMELEDIGVYLLFSGI
jgi:hypothetical protein